jgi:glycosyltransferase involved in cell wall biosynthesis
MKILYHVTTLEPRLPACEAVSQEIAALCARFDGSIMYINPNQHSPVFVPRLLYGFHRLREMRRREAGVRLHHLYNPDPFPFPVVRLLRRPVVYSLTCGVRDRRPSMAYFDRLAAVTAADSRSLEHLKGWGLTNVHLVQPGIDTSRFTYAPLPLSQDIRLMVGSAPWTPAQFVSKGVEALLDAARHDPRLKLVFLWRGVLADEMDQRVQRMNLSDQVTVLHRQVDVNSVLAGVHASIALASDPAILKSYPHSLIESLAAGKPVLVSQAIPMADYVARTGCGQVVEQVSPDSLLASVEALRGNYGAHLEAAREVGQRDFCLDGMLESFGQVYERVLGAPPCDESAGHRWQSSQGVTDERSLARRAQFRHRHQ